jgi:hypothetical protein
MNNRNKLPRNLFRFNDVGYTIGGPVLLPRSLKTKDKLFFFWSEEFQRQLRPNGANNRTVPTALEHKGDFSQSVDNNGNSFTIKDPSTGSPFPGNVIPASSQLPFKSRQGTNRRKPLTVKALADFAKYFTGHQRRTSIRRPRCFRRRPSTRPIQRANFPIPTTTPLACGVRCPASYRSTLLMSATSPGICRTTAT